MTDGAPKGKVRAVRIVAIVAVVLLAVLLAGSFWLAAFVMTGSRQTLDEARAWQQDRYDTSFYDEVAEPEYVVAGAEGYELRVQLLRNPVPTSRYVIISHGYTDNRMGSLKYARIYLDLGFNCIIYDLRGHGLNAEAPTTYGILEGRDLALLIEDTWARYPELTQLGLHGESLGAATTISALAYAPAVDFAVADCGFADIVGVLKHGYEEAGVPAFLVDVADLGARLRYGYALKDARPIDALDGNTVPVLFIHGVDDPFILSENSQRMYERTQGQTEIHLIDGAGHAESVLVAPEQYREYIEAFLSSIGA